MATTGGRIELQVRRRGYNRDGRIDYQLRDASLIWFANLLVLIDAVGRKGVERSRFALKAKRSAAEHSPRSEP
jgi:hypothetical protein